MYYRRLLLLLLSLPLLALAQQSGLNAEDTPPPSGVIVHQLGDITIEDHRVSGRTRSIEIVPDNGIPYLLIDTHGDGELKTQDETDGSSTTGWRVFNW